MVSERNAPTPEGRALGKIVARVTDSTLASLRQKFPLHSDERCQSCAYRADTFPNGCLETALDALVSVVKCEPFYCHLRFTNDGKPIDICAGWLIALSASDKLGELLDEFPPLKKIVEDWNLHRSGEPC